MPECQICCEDRKLKWLLEDQRRRRWTKVSGSAQFDSFFQSY